MVTITPASKSREDKRTSFTLFYLLLLTLFGIFSFVQMVRSKHLHDHEESKPTLQRDEGISVLRGATALAEEVSKIGAAHDQHVASLQHLTLKLNKKEEVPQQTTGRDIGNDEERIELEKEQEKLEAKDPVDRTVRSGGNVRGSGVPGAGADAADADAAGGPLDAVAAAGIATGKGVGNFTEKFVGNMSSVSRELRKKLKLKPPKIEGPEPPKFHAVTYATHGGRDDRFCRSVESAIRHNYDLTILGWGEKWRGLSQKLMAAEAFASSVDKDDIMLFTDAYDVLFAERSEAVRREFEAMKTPILFSGECGCWPHAMENRGRACFETYPKAPTPYRYLNSGTWIGRASNASAMLREVIKEAGSNFRNANDQKLVADFYIAGRFGIKLDFYNKIFQSMHMTLDPPLPHCDPTRDLQITIDGRFYNKLTKSRPAIFHFNGGGKKVHLQMEAAIWYKHEEFNSPEVAQTLRSTLVNTPTATDKGQQTRFDMLCPGYLKSTVSKQYYN